MQTRRSKAFSRIDWREAAALAGILALVWLLWDSWLVYPFKVLVVFFHELSHGLAALLTGGRVERVELVAGEGGACWTAGGNRFLILSAGYLGSLAWGGALLLASARTRMDQAAVSALGFILAAAALIWLRPFFSIWFLLTMAVGLALIAAGLYLPAGFCDFLLKAIGLTSVFYAILDIQDDILARPHLLESDAAQLARQTGLPTLFWGAIWFVAALAAAFFLLIKASRKSS